MYTRLGVKGGETGFHRTVNELLVMARRVLGVNPPIKARVRVRRVLDGFTLIKAKVRVEARAWCKSSNQG